MPSQEEIMSRSHIIRFYKEQLRKFDRIGIGGRTHHDVEVTERLIKATKRRLDQLVVRNIVL